MKDVNIKLSEEQYKNIMLLLHSWIEMVPYMKQKVADNSDLNNIFANLESSLVEIQTTLSKMDEEVSPSTCTTKRGKH
ncbi:hypothetical protein [Paenibacillus polymyxa]|uniref:Uncharacterized protein n=1 Tax=Paenibacillus polymyxa (strain SC2) TaxID=886882 RepID=E3EJY8_PAEPS|nr:hypothetical protein [Paenibacillus polymyxa]ADO60007.1 hypothetical protein PPSC2_28150 [Paenibacillus polymyxa SC2]WPQ59776.1 hypothetical protein SKN87_26160 [Paenibacillus polymyxa]